MYTNSWTNFVKRRILLTFTTLKKYIALVVAVFLAAMGVGLAIKSSVGLAAFDAFNQSITNTTGVRVGTVVMFVQMFFVLIQLLVLRKEATWHLLMQIPLVIILGQFINLFVDGIFGNLFLENYILRLLLFILAQVIISFAVSTLLVIDLIAMPVENLSAILAQKLPFKLGQIRQVIDILLILSALVISLVSSTEWTIREGTVLSALIFGPLMDFHMPRLKPLFKKWELVE